MKDSAFHIHAALEETHWWFTGRRRIVDGLVAKLLASSPSGTIVDVGCGTGGTVAALTGRYSCLGLDSSALAIDYARSKYPACEFRLGQMPADLQDIAQSTSLFLLMDVLEHIEDDRGFLAQLVALARPGAHILLTAPADPALWSRHDETAGHLRRYERSSLAALWQGLPVQARLLSPANFQLYPLIRLIRAVTAVIGSTFGGGGTDFKQPFPLLNRLLTWIFAGEAPAIEHYLDHPQGGVDRRGVSLIAVLRKLPKET